MRLLRNCVVVAILLSIACGAAVAERRKTSIALSVGSFNPQSSATSDKFGSSWSRISFKAFEIDKPEQWMFSPELGSYRLSNVGTSANLYPLTLGFERALNSSSKAQPYVTLRAGPYYGKVTDDSVGLSESKFGLNANAAIGLVISRRFFVEARYDYFSKIAGYDFEGFSVSAGMKLFDISL